MNGPLREPAPLVAAALALAIGGCSGAPADAGFSDVASLVSEHAGVTIEWLRDEEARGRADARVRELLAGELTVDTALQVALLQNAELQVTLEELGLARAELLEAGLIANPLLEAEMRFPGDPSAPLEIHIVQDFLSALSMPLKKRTAQAQLERTKLEVAERVLELVEEVRVAWFEAQAAAQLLESRRTIALAASASADAARALHDAGNFTDLERDEQLALDGKARLELAAAETERFEKRSALDARMGLWGAQAGWKLPAQLPPLPDVEPTLDRLEQTAMANRLDLAAARAAIDVQARALGLARATGWLDSVEVGVHWEREPDGTSTTGPSIGIPLPLFSRAPAQRERGEALLRQAQHRYRALAVTARAQTRSVAARMRTARGRAEYLRDTLLPLHSRIVEQAQLQYNAMQIGVFDLLHAKQEEIGVQSQAIEAMRDYWVARAGLDHALGGGNVRVDAD